MSSFCLRMTSNIAPTPTTPNTVMVGYQAPQPYLSSNLPVRGSATAAPKYWKESITPEANPAMRRPPMSMGAAAPTIEWVALTLNDTKIRNKQARNTPALVGPIKPDHMATEAPATTRVRKAYSRTATGERWPPKSLSETMPEMSEPATATSGTMFMVQMTAGGWVLRSSLRVLGEEEHGELVRTVPHGAGGRVSQRVKPNQRVAEDGQEAFFDAHAHVGLVARAGIAVVLDAVGVPGGFRGFARDQRDQHRHEGRNQGRDAEKPPPLIGREGPGADGKAGEDKRRQVVDRHLAELNHEAEDAREGAPLAAVEPRGVDLDHARGTEGLQVTVKEPDQGEGGKRAGKGNKAVNQVDQHRAHRANHHRGPAPNPVAEQAVDELPDPVGDRPPGENEGDLRVVEMELLDHARRGKAEVVPAHVIGSVRGSQNRPVQAPPRPEALGIPDVRG